MNEEEKEIAKHMLYLRLCKGVKISIKYKHVNSTRLKHYPGEIVYIKKYKLGCIAMIKFLDKTNKSIELPYNEYDKTWKFL
jgi:hypothetical protein